MKYWNLFFLVLALVFGSCNNDDNGGGPDIVPPKMLGEVAPGDDAKIREFLETHFYNYEDFDPATQPVDFDFKIKIDTIAGDHADKRPMIEDAQGITVNVSPAFLGLDTGEGDIPHKLYYLEARAGGGGSPTYADSTLITYRGSLLNGTLFDQSQDFMWFPLYSRILGFAHGIANMKAASPDQIIENGDGTITFGNSGIGLFILPSGLAYYNGSGPSGSLPTYSPLMFQIELGAYVEHTDTDGDGVPNIEEDINKNGFLRDDDTDQDGQFDFIDVDDDGDKILTRLEISNAEGVIIKPYPDTNGDGIPDYLDPKNK